MVPSISHWIHAQLFLQPSQPRRPLTPPSSDRKTLKPATRFSPNPNAAVKASPFFKVPFEVRKQIYLAAFSNKVVHLDLEWEDDEGDFLESGRFNLPRFRRTPFFCARDYAGKEAWWDNCRLKPALLPELLIGVMGWLLSCRQAYTETIDILYACNTIHIQENELLFGLSSLLPPQRLAQITSLELSPRPLEPVRPRYLHPPPRKPMVGWPIFEVYGLFIKSTFPRLRRLYLDLHHTPSEYAWKDEDRVMQAMDELALELGRQVESIEIVPKDSLYKVITRKFKRQSDPVEATSVEPRGERFQRTVKMDPNGSCSGGHEIRYWIRQGRRGRR